MASGTLLETPTTFLSPHRSPERYNVIDFHLPVLIYRSCLPSNPTASGVSTFLEPNHWIQGADSNAANLLDNTHQVAHQCLAVLKGYGRLLLGKGPFQRGTDGGEVPAGVTVDLYERDVLVLPAGVLHSSISSQGNYEYIVFYPKRNPRLHESRIEESQELHLRPALPDRDPIFGVDGPLVGMWKEAEEAWLKMADL